MLVGGPVRGPIIAATPVKVHVKPYYTLRLLHFHVLPCSSIRSKVCELTYYITSCSLLLEASFTAERGRRRKEKASRQQVLSLWETVQEQHSVQFLLKILLIQ